VSSPELDGRSVYADYINAELDTQQQRKTSLEQRGMAVITTSGALVTLLFGLAALVTGVEKYTLPPATKDWLVGAVFLFVLAAIAALLTNLPLMYEYVDPDELKGAVESRWDDDKREAQRMVALTRIKVYRATNQNNMTKGWVLAFAMTMEIIAVLCVANAVRIILEEL
jgi:hypothetical protein